MSSIHLFLIWVAASCVFTCGLQLGEAAGHVGINYGFKGDNLPAPAKVIALLKSRNVGLVRIFEPNATVLQALRGSNIQVVLGTLNEDLPKLSTDSAYATAWVNTNVAPYHPNVNFRYVSAGNEAVPGNLAAYVLPAMKGLDAALKAANISGVPVSTVVPTSALASSFPPSSGKFAGSEMGLIAQFLAANRYPLLVNVYPYFAYAADAANISLDYALFGSKEVVVTDGGLRYSSLFDAIVDAFYAALDAADAASVGLVVSETGWPSAGNGGVATVANAQTYNNNLVKHVSGTGGTPKKPGTAIETYIFALFNEDLKPGGIVEESFGLYQPNLQEVYHVTL